jgi:hypothetical protein
LVPPNYNSDRNATCQTEAIPPDMLLDIEKTSVKDHIDFDILDRVIRQGCEDRDVVLARLRKWGCSNDPRDTTR